MAKIDFIKFEKVQIPEFKENKSGEWVKYGIKDDYPKYLIDMMNKSTIHGSILSSKGFYISGNGLEVECDNLRDKAKGLQILKNCNPMESLSKVVSKVVSDWLVFGWCTFEVIWKPNGTFDLYHIPTDKIRMSNDGMRFAYSANWKKYKSYSEQYEEDGLFKVFEKFDPENPNGSQILALSEYKPGQEYYTTPEYLQALPYIEIDYKIGEYHLNNISNGFFAGSILTINDSYPGDEPAEKFAKDFRAKYQGSGAKDAGGVAIIYTEPGSDGTNVEHLQPNNLDKQFLELRKQATQMIFTGHTVTSPALLGVETESSFGNRTEILEKMEVFQSTYVTPKQEKVEEALFSLYNLNFKLNRVKPIQEKLSEAVLQTVATEDELRELHGLEPLGITQTAQTYKKDKENELEQFFKVAEAFGRCGDSVKVVFAKDLHYKEWSEVNEEKFKKMAFDLTELDGKVLSILESSPTTPPEDIAKSLNVDKSNVDESIKRLTDQGYIREGVVNIDGEDITSNEVTEAGEDVPKDDFEIVYRYAPRAGLTPIIDGTRDFCRRLIQLNRVYTKTEIDQMTNILGYDVYNRRGGYWNRGNGNISYSCRHIWRSELIQK